MTFFQLKDWSRSLAIILPFLACFQSCITSDELKPLQSLSVEESKLFASCEGEGLEKLKIFKENKLIAISEFEWVASSNGFRSELYESFGKPLLTINVEDLNISLGGKLGSEIRNLEIEEKTGFLMYKKKRVPIKVKEIGCIASNHFPLDWSKNLWVKELDESTGLVFVEHSKEDPEAIVRKINLVNSYNSGGSLIKVCASFEMTYYLMSVPVNWCYFRNPVQYGKLDIDDLSLEWVNIE